MPPCRIVKVIDIVHDQGTGQLGRQIGVAMCPSDLYAAFLQNASMGGHVYPRLHPGLVGGALLGRWWKCSLFGKQCPKSRRGPPARIVLPKPATRDQEGHPWRLPNRSLKREWP